MAGSGAGPDQSGLGQPCRASAVSNQVSGKSLKTIRPSAACRAASAASAASAAAAASVHCAASVAAFSGKLYQPVPGARPPGLPKISSSPRLISGAVFSVGIPPTAFAITNYFGQFDCNVCIALLMSSSGITPRSARLLSLMDTASSGTACHVLSTRQMLSPEAVPKFLVAQRLR